MRLKPLVPSTSARPWCSRLAEVVLGQGVPATAAISAASANVDGFQGLPEASAWMWRSGFRVLHGTNGRTARLQGALFKLMQVCRIRLGSEVRRLRRWRMGQAGDEGRIAARRIYPMAPLRRVRRWS